MKQDLYLTPYTNINSKWIKDRNVTMETIKYLKNTGNILQDICNKDIWGLNSNGRGSNSKN